MSPPAVPWTNRWLTSANLLVISFAFLAWGIWLANGAYTPLALRITLISFAFVLAAAWRARRQGVGDAPARAIVAILTASLFWLSALREPGIYLRSDLYAEVAVVTSWLMVLVVLAGYLVSWGQESSVITRVRNVVFGLAVVVLCALQVTMPVASPSPAIDVWTTAQDSAEHWLTAENPYVTPVSKIYGEGEAFGYVLNSYNYLPANLLFQMPAYALLGDVRYALVAALWLFLGSLWLLSRGVSPALRQLLVLSVLAQPRLLFVIEQAWTEPFILAAFGLMLLARVRGWRMASSLAYGTMLSLKQYLLFFAFHWLILERRWRFLLGGTAVACLTVVPFLLWDPWSLWHEGFLFQLRTGFRPDSLTVASALYRAIGLEAPKWWSVVVGGVVAVAMPWWLQTLPSLARYLFSAIVTTFALFLFGSQAFINYYFLVGGMLLCAVAVLPRRA